MIGKLVATYQHLDIARQLFVGFAAICLLSIFAAIGFEQPLFGVLPAAVLMAYWMVVDWKKGFWLLIASLPFSIEFFLSNGLATDLPNEPLMILLTGIYLLFTIQHSRQINSAYLRHPLSLLVLLHLGWIIIATLFSTDFIVSLKWTLAKIWYIVPFYFIAGYIINSEKRYTTFFWTVFVSLMITVAITVVRHGLLGFTFAEVNRVMKPFYRNHVNYAAILVLFFPYIWFFTKEFATWSLKWWVVVLGGILTFVAIQLSFTRAAYVGLVIAFGAYFIIHFRLMRWVLAVGIAVVIGVLSFFLSNNTFMDYTTDYKKTITHSQFSNLMEATAKGEDISTMERVYRWLAGYYMSREKPVTGFGPGNFYEHYQSYSVTGFSTYVSDNKEKSGIHSYYLLMLVEQGWPGLLIFLLLIVVTLIVGERIYHESTTATRKRIVMSVLLSIIVIDALQLINDLLEADKVGPFFFLAMAILVRIDLLNQADSKNVTKQINH